MRALLPLALAACFTPRTPAQKPRAYAYNALCIAAGLASLAVGYEVATRATDAGGDESDGLQPFFVGLVGGGGLVGGTFLILGGLSGMAFTAFDYSPTH